MCRRRVLFSWVCLAFFIFTLAGSVYAGDFKEGFHPAKVKDISDRKYEPAVIELLDNAEDSIVLSMYILNPSTEPVRLLLKDLEEAIARGVSVEIYLNTRFKSNDESSINNGKLFDFLAAKGAKIYHIPSFVRLHDKLIVIDKRYVVIGSTNWSVSALKNNLEATSLIDSPEFATEMLVRLRTLPLTEQEPGEPQRPDRPEIERVLPAESTVVLSRSLLEDKHLFSYMLTRTDDRSMNTYLLLLAYSEIWKEKEFFVSLEDLALDLRMPSNWSDSAARRQVIKTLKKLQNRYKLVKVNFRHAKDAWVEIKELQGDIFELKGYFFDPDFLASKSTRVKFVSLIKILLEQEGTSIESFTQKEISKRFYINEKTLSAALKDISELH